MNLFHCMKILNSIKISYKNLVSAKWRSFLTILGIIIGVASVILIMSIGQSAQTLILNQISGIGSNLIGVLPGASDEKGPPAAVLGISVTTLTYEDLNALRDNRNVPEIESGAGYVMGTAGAVYKDVNLNVSFVGTTSSYIEVENVSVLRGRFFNKEEEINLSRVAVLGSNIAKDLFGEKDPLNSVFKLKDHNFTVIGVFAERGSSGFGFSSQDDSIYIPLKTGQKIILGINHLGYIRLKAKNQELIPSAIVNIKNILRERHNIDDPEDDDFSVRDQTAAINIITNITNILRYFLLVIGAISLVVGGVGIMNIMLIAVSQRIREVGLRKAVGARTKDVLTQFLIESATISFIGGFIGIIVGLFLAYLASIIIKQFGYDWPFLISNMAIFFAVIVSILIGIIFGMYPAHKASRIPPTEALRYE